MDKTLADASAWIDYFSPYNKSIYAAMLQHLIDGHYPIYICPVIYQEVLQGMREEKRFEFAKKTLLSYNIADIPLMDATDYAVDLFRTLRRKGITIRKPNDCLVAAYAILGDMYLLHNDRDFTEIAKGSALKLIDVL
jgi:predicted nucleic acid-binding protein